MGPSGAQIRRIRDTQKCIYPGPEVVALLLDRCERQNIQSREADPDCRNLASVRSVRAKEAASVYGPPEYRYPVGSGRPDHPEINEKSRFSADRKSLTIYLFGYQTKLLSLESALAWRENLPILSLGLEDELPGASQG